MKLFLTSSLSVFLLAGCNNFELKEVKTPATKKDQGFKIETKDDKAPEPQTQPSIDSAAKPAQGDNSPAPAISQQQATPAPQPAAPATPPAVAAPAPQAEINSPVVTGTAAPKPAPPASKPPAPAPAAPAAPPAAAAPAKPAPPADAANIISFTEFMNLQNLFAMYVGKEAIQIFIKPVIAAGIQPTDIKSEISSTLDKLNYRLLNKDKSIAEFKDVKIDINDFNSSSQSGYEMLSFCVGAKCNLLFVTIVKIEQDQIKENYPYYFKLVNGKYVEAAFKKVEDYQAEHKATTDQKKDIKLVPQVMVRAKLNQYLSAQEEKIISVLKEKLKADATSVYSDLVLARDGFKPDSFRPRFSVENEKLTISAQLESTGAAKAISFKGEIQDELTSINSEAGLLLTVETGKKNEFYILNLTQEKYVSKIANIDKALQTVVCSIAEDEKILFTSCLPVPAEKVFKEAQVIEGSATEKIKADK